jgi:mono/diheme cytochrome c family protein
VDAQPADDLRESARALLETNCGECHTRGSPNALPRALAVYDLDQTEWSRRMTADQLREAERRLREPNAPTRGEDEIRAIHASPEELDRFHRYVEREIATRPAGDL